MNTFGKKSFLRKLKSMLTVDFKRMFTMPLIYIMAGVCFAMPILILVMTTMMGDAEEGAEAMGTFTNVWQAIGSVSGAGMSMDLTSMCNINMLYFLVAVLVCIFVADDFKSGYAKNLFTVRSKKVDYVCSKSLVCFVGATIMFVAYFIGAMIGGAIAGLPFTTEGFGAGGVIACMLSKIFMTAIFVSIALCLGTVAKQKLWLSILCSFAAGMLLFTMIPMISPLDSGFVNVVMCLAGGGLFAVGLGAVSNLILNKTSLV
ncbi:MAG: ABC transporter permease [Clostridia bacterium]|nr:ABC transporter permease [Clostridia bacterium]